MYIRKNQNFRSIAHQGYSITGENEGNCRLSAYYAAARAGFDYAETDLKFTKDGVVVCSHDPVFVDTNNGTDKIAIADHTLEVLKTFGYHGETIATLDEVVRACKEQGLGLYIDHTYLFDPEDTEKWNKIFDVVSRYRMEEHVAWLIVDPKAIDTVLRWHPYAEINLVNMSRDLTEFIEQAASVRTPYNKVSINGHYRFFTVEQLIEYNRMIPRGIGLEFWTVDNIHIYKEFMPYATGLTSNKLSFQML